jgi:hypothetical protein
MSRPYIYLALTFIVVFISSMHPFDTPPDTETTSETPEEFSKELISRVK